MTNVATKPFSVWLAALHCVVGILALRYAAALPLATFLMVAAAAGPPAAQAQQIIPATLPECSGPEVGETVEIPIIIGADLPGAASNAAVVAMDFTIRYDPTILAFVEEARVDGTISEQFASFDVYFSGPGAISVSGANALTEPVAGATGDTLTVLEATTRRGGTSPLTFQRARFNEGSPPVAPEAGAVTVEP